MAEHVQFQLTPEDHEWFERVFPMKGAKAWFFRACFYKLRELVEQGRAPAEPDEKVEAVVQEFIHDAMTGASHVERDGTATV